MLNILIYLDKPRPKAMFNFMKKDKGGGSGTDDKERKKKEDKKKEKKEKKRDRDHDTGPCTAEEISRLEEVRRSYFGRRKKVKGHTEATSPTAEQDDSSTASMSPITSPNDSNKNLMMESQAATGNGKLTYSNTNLTTREANWSPSKPPVPPKPTKRGILKGTSSFRMEAQTSDFIQTVDDDERLVINTIANEEYIYDIPSRIKSSFQTADTTALTKSPVSTSSEYSSAAQSPVQSPMTPLASAMDAGEGVGDSHAIKNYSVELKLPAISGPRLPKVRTLTLSRQTSGDFGFCLRRAFTDLGHLPQNVADSSGTASKRKESLFAEPKEFNRNNPTGLLPGDRLLEVNDTSVAEMTREEVADLIRASGDAVKLVVQPVPELSELTVRSTSDGTEIELDESHIKTGTLTRSASRRLKKQAVSWSNTISVLQRFYPLKELILWFL